MSQMALALIILAITIVLFITEPVPIVVTAIGASIAYAYTGIIEVKDFEAETNINDLDGGWAQAETPVITEDAGAAFDKAMKNLVGVDYTPVALLSTQVVSGTNYCFLCEATVVYPGAETSYALVYIYADLEGNAEITQIVNIAE